MHFCCTRSSGKMFGDKGSCTADSVLPSLKFQSFRHSSHCRFSRWCVGSGWQHSGFFVPVLMMSFIQLSPAMPKSQFSKARLVILPLSIAGTRVDSSTEWVHFTCLQVCASGSANSSNSHCRERHGHSQASPWWGRETLLLELLLEGI